MGILTELAKFLLLGGILFKSACSLKEQVDCSSVFETPENIN